jgi:hypothetical protein
MTSADAAAGTPADSSSPAPSATPVDSVASADPGGPASGPAPVIAPVGGPLLPDQSREDTDAAWGEYTGRDDDLLYRDRPPHWRD